MVETNTGLAVGGLLFAGAIGMSVAGALHWILLKGRAFGRAATFFRRWLAAFGGYYAGFIILTLAAGPGALGQIRPRFASPDWRPSDEPLSWGFVVLSSMAVSLLYALTATFWRRTSSGEQA